DAVVVSAEGETVGDVRRVARGGSGGEKLGLSGREGEGGDVVVYCFSAQGRGGGDGGGEVGGRLGRAGGGGGGGRLQFVPGGEGEGGARYWSVTWASSLAAKSVRNVSGSPQQVAMGQEPFGSKKIGWDWANGTTAPPR